MSGCNAPTSPTAAVMGAALGGAMPSAAPEDDGSGFDRWVAVMTERTGTLHERDGNYPCRARDGLLGSNQWTSISLVQRDRAVERMRQPVRGDRRRSIPGRRPTPDVEMCAMR